MVILVSILLIAAVSLYFMYNNLLEPVDPAATDDYRIVEIPSGANTAAIATILRSGGLIQNERVFRFYVQRRDLGQSLVAGTYRLSPSMSLGRIADIIRSGDVHAVTSWFTIPEGFTVEQIAQRLADAGLVDRENFLHLARQPSEAIMQQFPFLQEVNNPDIYYLLEGYLFPDTYEVFTDAGEEAIITLMLHRLAQVIDEEHRQRITEIGSSMHEVLTLASIVEREGRVAHERSRIAGVFLNRLDVGQRLESCATIQYILGETREFLFYRDLQIPSPYNTYLHAGLPPGPIAAPGEASIVAVLYPEDTDYFYFNYKYDSSGEHYFSRTLAEHNRNVQIAEQRLR